MLVSSCPSPFGERGQQILSIGSSDRSVIIGNKESKEGKSQQQKQNQLSLLAYGIIERLFSFIVGFGAVSYWRGVWLLWDELVLVDNPIQQNWICLLAGTILLLSLRSFRSVFAPPMVYMPDDADDLDGFTLDLCDDLWFEPASIIHQRRKLSTRKTLRVVNNVLLEGSRHRQQQPQLSGRSEAV